MPRENLIDTDDLSFIDDLAKLMNRSDDWIEERKKLYSERAALSRRINEQLADFQESMSEELRTKGYVECDFDIDERDAMVEKFHRDLWKEHNAQRLAL
jgi:CRISPR/Cas system-associated exonuclease Cas4 (RecB family)